MSTKHTGQLQTALHAGLKMTFDYSYVIDEDDRSAKVTWKISPYAYTDNKEDVGNAHYHLAQNEQKLTLRWIRKGKTHTDGSFRQPDSYSKNGHTVYKGYTDKGSWLDQNHNGDEFFDTNGNWTGIRRWVKILGTKWASGSFTVDYDSDGEASFYVKGDFAWWSPSNPNKRMIFEKIVSLKSIPKAYKVSYDANGGKGAPDNQKKIQGKTLTLSSKVPTLSNFTFVGWGTSATDTSPNYQPKGKYTANAKLSLYAIWKHDITYKSNGGTISGVATQTKYSKTSIKLFPSNKVSRRGYKFRGWCATQYNPTINVPSSVKLIASNSTFNDNSITTLYPYWSPITDIPITLKEYYDDNVKSVDKIVKVTYDAVMSDANKQIFSKYKREGYKLLGWSTTKVSPFLETPSQNQLNKLSLFDYTKKYTSDPAGITLYPVLQYTTTCYVYNGNQWKLAIPYVYGKDNKWHQCLMYGYYNNTWKL